MTAAELVERSCAEQGIPVVLEDADTVARVVQLLAGAVTEAGDG